MSLIKELLLERKIYTGDALEKGGTSIKGSGAAPAVKELFAKGQFTTEMTVLDYGAGKYARNADYLRDLGVKVYAFDPYNGKTGDGWEHGFVSDKLPRGLKFDVAFSSFVLNVVPEYVEDEIINTIKRHTKHQIHITRNMDIFDSVKNALKKKDKTVGGFFLNEFANSKQKSAYEAGELSDETILEFCHFGVQTSRGFQRIPVLEDKTFRLTRKTSGYKIYEK